MSKKVSPSIYRHDKSNLNPAWQLSWFLTGFFMPLISIFIAPFNYTKRETNATHMYWGMFFRLIFFFIFFMSQAGSPNKLNNSTMTYYSVLLINGLLI